MNKKILMFSLLGLFAIGLVIAGSYAIFSATFTVTPAISIEGGEQVLGVVYSGGIIEGDVVTISNDAPTERTIILSETSNCDVTTSYVGELELTKKDTSTWLPTGDTITIGYTIIGETFEVTGVPDGYTAIYYKDAVVGLEGRIANPQPAIEIVSNMGDLPQFDDVNAELEDYCASDGYNQCNGAKIWVVLNEDISGGVLNWANMGNYYYETDLIQYNAEGSIVMSPESNLEVTPIYEVAVGESGGCTVTTTIA